MKLGKKQEKYLILAFAVNYGMYLLLRLFFYATYESQLDEMMLAGIRGVSGSSTAYILYSHVLIGWILKALTAIMPFINWYYAYLCGCVLLALTVVSYLIIRRTENKIGWTIIVVLAAFVGYECYILPGSMKTASVLAAAMLLVLADYIESGVRSNRRRECLIAVLAILSSAVSFSVFWITVLIGAASIGIYYGIQSGRNIRTCLKKENINLEAIRYFAVLMGGIFALAVVFRIADDVSYRLSGQLEAAEYRSAMIRMYGYGMGDYDEQYEETYGVNAAEYAAIKNGSFGVTGRSSWQILEHLSREGRDISAARINKYFKTVPMALFRYGIFYLFIIGLFFLFYSRGKNKTIMVWTYLALLILVFLVFYLMNAWQNNWMVFVAVLPLLLPLLLALKEAEAAEYRYLWAYLAVLSVILYAKFSPGMVSSVSTENMTDRFASVSSSQVNIIDLNAYFKAFSATKIYTADILWNDSIKVSNGAYALMDGFADDVLTSYSPDSVQYHWLYNAKNVNVEHLVFED